MRTTIITGALLFALLALTVPAKADLFVSFPIPNGPVVSFPVRTDTGTWAYASPYYINSFGEVVYYPTTSVSGTIYATSDGAIYVRDGYGNRRYVMLTSATDVSGDLYVGAPVTARAFVTNGGLVAFRVMTY